MMCEPFTVKREVCLLNLMSFRMALRAVRGVEYSEWLIATTCE